MKIEESKYSIAELVEFYSRGDLTVNDEYQRQPRLWPGAARSYFIDTILNRFPFPKIYLLERLDRSTRRPVREIVDGQQRMTSIVDYYNDRFALGKNSLHFEGKKFSDLSDDDQVAFLTYTVSCDVIRDADKAHVLQMFRRMNAYTLPLNDAERRHSEFFGQFKDWINSLLDEWGSMLADWKILTSRSIIRMEDAEFFAELALALKSGVVSTSPAQLRRMYEEYDTRFPYAGEWKQKIDDSMGYVRSQLSQLQRSHMTKSYVFLSLVTALIHNRWGIPDLEAQIGARPTGQFASDPRQALDGLLALASAHETKDVSGRYKEYVEACKGGGNRAKQRLVRVDYICRALQGTL